MRSNNLGFHSLHVHRGSVRAGIVLALGAVLASACGSSPEETDDPGTVDGGSIDGPAVRCADRTGGAFVTLGNAPGTLDGPDQIILWITNSAFIDEAIQHQARGTWRVAAVEEVIAGTDCDPTHPWHIDPVRVNWVDVSAEECDATITYVTAGGGAWAGRNWCPWGGVVVAVDDRRPGGRPQE